MRKVKEKHVGAIARNVIGNELIGLNNDALDHLPKQSSITRILLRHKEADHLPNPNTPDFSIPEKYAYLILHDSGVDNPEFWQLETWIWCKHLILILTMKMAHFVPKMFFQLYTWHVKVGNSYPPCIYFLLQRKYLPTYSKMFEILKYLLPSLAP